MSSFFKKAFGWLGGGEAKSDAPAGKPLEAEPYKDCMIVPQPVREGSQWRLAGTITTVIDGETVERPFIRADLFASEEEARGSIIRKGRQIIDENGRALFTRGKTGSA
ncbi:MAG: HlyU family transcriptional regulator [Pararhizobium sp.]